MAATWPVRQHPNVVPGAQHERRLDRVVREDLAAERRAAGQQRQAAGRDERSDPHDGVVAPIIAARSLPERHAALEQRPVEPRVELLEPREQAVPSHGVAHRLDQPGAWIGLHGADEAGDGLAGHQAVRVEDHHEVVGVTPALAELGDVAGLAPFVVRAAAIEDRRPVGARAQRHHRVLGGNGDGGARVAEHEEVDLADRLGRQRLCHGANRREDTRNVFLVDRQQHGGASLAGRRRQAWTSREAAARENGATMAPSSVLHDDIVKAATLRPTTSP